MTKHSSQAISSGYVLGLGVFFIVAGILTLKRALARSVNVKPQGPGTQVLLARSF
jgi:hypothetical protein